MPSSVPPPADGEGPATGSIDHGTKKTVPSSAAFRSARRAFVPIHTLRSSGYPTALSLVLAGEAAYATVARTQKMGDLALAQITNAGPDPRRRRRGDVSNITLPPVSDDVQSAEEKGFAATDIIEGYYVITAPFLAITTPPRAGQVDGRLKALAATWVARTIHAAKQANHFMELLDYDSAGKPSLRRAVDIPATEEASMLHYIKDPRYNSRTGKMIFHVRIRSSISIAELKATNSPVHPRIKKDYFAFLDKHQYWVMSQQISATKIQRQGWLLNSCRADNIDNLREQLD